MREGVALLHELHAAPRDVALAVLTLLVVAGAWTALSRTWTAPAVMLGLAGLWLLVNSSVELAVVLPLVPGHGVTLADLVTVPVVALALLARYARTRVR